MKFTKMHGCGNDYVYVDGGKSPNVVPEHASLAVYVRAGQKDYLEDLFVWIRKKSKTLALIFCVTL